jgi:hypothetical protein
VTKSAALVLSMVLALGACSNDDQGPAADLFPHPFDSGSSPSDFSPSEAPSPPADSGQTAASHEELARYWAPTWYHDTDSSNYEGDYIVAYDFDGDTRSDNNWENLHKAGADLSAVIYYSVVETETHWFLLYCDFHPQDWDENCQPIPFGPDRCHENDMEGAMVVVEKDGSKHGRFQLLYTEAHNILYIFTNDSGVSAFHSKSLKGVPVTFDGAATASPGEHPELYVESKGHGVCALRYSGGEHCKHPTTGNVFPGGDGVVFRYRGKAETPTSGDDRDVGYKLVPLLTTLWPRRKDICDSGCTFDGTMTFEGMTLGKAFDGDSHGDDKANPPWAWDDPNDGPVYRGGFFFRPAETALTHLKLPGPFSKTYLVNPFLKGL